MADRIVIYRDYGLHNPYAVAYYNRVDRRNRLSHTDCEYACGRYPPNYPVPAIRQCPWCQSTHLGHDHFICDDGLIVPNGG